METVRSNEFVVVSVAGSAYANMPAENKVLE
jgi:hypothetical protein